AGTEQDHSQEILAELMEAISRSFGGKLTVDQVEGDALCCTTDRTDVGVTDWLRETYRVFQRRLRDIRSATTCPCRACATVQDLGRSEERRVGKEGTVRGTEFSTTDTEAAPSPARGLRSWHRMEPPAASIRTPKRSRTPGVFFFSSRRRHTI